METQHPHPDAPWPPRLAGAEGPIYLAIADAIGAAIQAGQFRPGDRLPTHRALAEALGVDLTTVTRAYAEARRRGLLHATVGRGTFVGRQDATPAAPQPEAATGPVDLGMNLPPQPLDPPLRDLLRQGLAEVLARSDAADLLTYRTGAGSAEEREAGAAWLRPTLGIVAPERLLLCPGAQPALLATLGAVAGVGDLVLTDALTYPGLRGAAGQLGIRLLGLPGDADGLLPDAIAEACRTRGAKALYCVPTMHNPTTVTMPPERRQAIAAEARRHGLHIIEDDAYGLLPSSPLPALATLAPEITFHVATLSKVLNPALRAAYVVAPDAQRAGRLAAALRANVLMASPLLTGLLTGWVRDGTAAAILAAIRRECAARQAMARDILPPRSSEAHPEGLHLWLRLPPHWDRLDFVAHLRRREGLAVVPSDAFLVGDAVNAPAAVRVSLGAARDQPALREALLRLADALGEDRRTAFADVV